MVLRLRRAYLSLGHALACRTSSDGHGSTNRLTLSEKDDHQRSRAADTDQRPIAAASRAMDRCFMYVTLGRPVSARVERLRISRRTAMRLA